MTIEVTCQCGKRFGVPDERAGKRGRCFACGAVVRIAPQLAIERAGSFDFERFEVGHTGDDAVVRRAAEAGLFTGFRKKGLKQSPPPAGGEG